MKRPFKQPGIRNAALPLLLILPLATYHSVHAAEAEWALEQDEGRIQVYTRPVAESPFREVKAVAMIDAPMAQVVAAMGDGQGCSEWREMCKSSEVLTTVSDTERYVHLVLDMPWPVADRDMVIHSIANIDAPTQTVTVQLQSASSRLPEQDYVRAISNGQYRIKALSEQQVEFTYIMHTDLGGDLPPDMINPRAASSAYEDVRRLQVLLEH